MIEEDTDVNYRLPHTHASHSCTQVLVCVCMFVYIHTPVCICKMQNISKLKNKMKQKSKPALALGCHTHLCISSTNPVPSLPAPRCASDSHWERWNVPSSGCKLLQRRMMASHYYTSAALNSLHSGSRECLMREKTRVRGSKPIWTSNQGQICLF